MDKPSHFKIIDNGKYFTIVNEKARDFKNHHTHINKKGKGNRDTCEMLIRLVCKKRVPKSPYLRESAKRIRRDRKYIEKIEIKEEKDKDRIYYFNPQKGVRR